MAHFLKKICLEKTLILPLTEDVVIRLPFLSFLVHFLLTLDDDLLQLSNPETKGFIQCDQIWQKIAIVAKVYKSSALSSVTRFDKKSPLWQKFISLRLFLEGLFNVWQKF